MANLIQIKRSAVPGNVPAIATGPADDVGLQLGELAINTYDGKLFSRQQQPNNAIDRIFEIGLKGSTSVKQVYYVSKSGNDLNSGTSLDQSKLTIRSAVEATRAMLATATATVSGGEIANINVINPGSGYSVNYPPEVTIFDDTGSGAKAVAQIEDGSVVGIRIIDAGSGYSNSPEIYIEPSGGDAVIFVKSGDYTERNPIYIPRGVSLVGDSLRTTTVRPINPGLDVFWVNNKSYCTEMTFRGHEAPSAVFAFPSQQINGISNANPARVTFTGGFQYDRAKCYRDVGLIVDALSQDLLFGDSTVNTYQSNYGFNSFDSGITVGQSQSTFAGVQYWEQEGYVIPNDELAATLSAFAKIRTELLALPGLSVGAQTKITNEIALITDIFNGTIPPVDITDTIVPNGTSVVNTADVTILQSNRSAVQNTLQTFVNGIISLSPTLLARCVRDVGYIIDSISYDIKYGGNRQAVQAGTYYLGYSSTISAVPNETRQVTQAYNYLKTMMQYVLTNTALPNTYQTNQPQEFLSNAGTASEVTLINNNIQLIIDTVINGPGPFWTNAFTATFSGTTMTVVGLPQTYTLTPGYTLNVTGATNTTPIIIASGSSTSFTLNQAPTGVSGTVVVNAGPPPLVPVGLTPNEGAVSTVQYAYDLLQANREFIREELLSFIDGFSFDRGYCGRDVGLIVDAVIQDLLSDGSTQTTFAAIQYWTQGVGTAGLVFPSDQLTATVAAIQQAGTIAAGYVATANEQNFVTDEFDLIASIINNGTANITNSIVSNALYSSTVPAVTSAYTALQTNKSAIQTAVINWINTQISLSTPGFVGLVYDQDKCRRDVGFMIDSVCFDLAYNVDPTYAAPSNKQAIQSGVYYYRYTGSSYVTGELEAVVSAYDYIKTLAQYIIQGQQVPVSYQELAEVDPNDVVSQVGVGSSASLIATPKEFEKISRDIDLMIKIIGSGPSFAPEPRPIELTRLSTDTVENAANLLYANRSFITAEVLAYVDYNFSYGHSYKSGDAISIRQVQGMYEINNNYIHQISNVTQTQPVRVTFTKPHTLNDSSEVRIHGVLGTTRAHELNWDPIYQTNRYYTKYINSTTVDLFYDVDLTNPVDGTVHTGYDTPTQGPFTSSSVPISIVDVSISGMVGTIQFNGGHGLSTGQFLVLDGFADSRWNGVYSATVIDSVTIRINFPESQNTNPGATWAVDTTPPGPPTTIGTITVSGGCVEADPYFYVKYVDYNHCDLYVDKALTKPVNSIGYGTYLDGGVAGTGSLPMSPYVHNCSSITTTGVGMRVDGHLSTGLRSMVLDSFTQINEGGVGIEIINRGYAQLVSIYTICTEKGIHTLGGGFCSIENSNCSFGTYALYADGLSETLYSGATDGVNQVGTVINLKNMSKRPNYDDSLDLETKLTLTGVKVVAGIISVNSQNRGEGYLPNDKLTLTGGTLLGGATASVFNVSTVTVVGTPTITASGTHAYTTGDVLTFTSGFSTPAVMQVTASGGTITGLTIINGGVKNTTSAVLRPDFINGIPVVSGDNASGYDTEITVVYGVNTANLTINATEGYSVAPTGAGTNGNQVLGIATTATRGGSPLVPTTAASLDVYFTIRATFNTLHYLQGDELLTFENVGGMTQLNGNSYYVNLIGSGTQVDLYDDIALETGVNTSGFEEYTSGGVATLHDYYTVVDAGQPTVGEDTGASSVSVTLAEKVVRPIPDSSAALFRQRSRIQTSGHGFEFIGSGTTLATATPQSGAYPIPGNETQSVNGGRVYFTATNERGNFLIGTDLTINNDTGTISGRTFNKSLFAIMTPYILALEG